MQTFVISLKRSILRRKQVQAALENIRLEWSFLDAVDGSKFIGYPAAYQPKKVNRLQGYALTPSEVACFLSHKKAWTQCIQKNQITLVLEDDFQLENHFEKVIETLITDMTDWFFVRLQGINGRGHSVVAECDGFKLVKNQGDPVGAMAYLIKPSAAKNLLECSKDIYEPVDHYLEHQKKNGLIFLAIKPYPVDTTGVSSTILDRIERKPIRGLRKTIRSVNRLIDRCISRDPWFPR